MLRLFADRGEKFVGVGSFKGYTEIVIDSAPWIANLPESVEAVFAVDCTDADAQLHYGAADGGSTAQSCSEARKAAAAMHERFLQTYGLSAAEFPLLRLRPDNWKAPFA